MLAVNHGGVVEVGDFSEGYFGLFSQRPNIPAVPGPLFGGNAAPGPFLDYYDLRDAAVVDAETKTLFSSY